jgi:hypothetical protein
VQIALLLDTSGSMTASSTRRAASSGRW